MTFKESLRLVKKRYPKSFILRKKAYDIMGNTTFYYVFMVYSDPTKINELINEWKFSQHKAWISAAEQILNNDTKTESN